MAQSLTFPPFGHFPGFTDFCTSQHEFSCGDVGNQEPHRYVRRATEVREACLSCLYQSCRLRFPLPFGITVQQIEYTWYSACQQWRPNQANIVTEINNIASTHVKVPYLPKAVCESTTALIQGEGWFRFPLFHLYLPQACFQLGCCLVFLQFMLN